MGVYFVFTTYYATVLVGNNTNSEELKSRSVLSNCINHGVIPLADLENSLSLFFQDWRQECF